MGIMFADFWMLLITDVSNYFRQIRKSGTDNDVLHFFRRIAGNLSGPGDALLVSSSMADSRCSGPNSMSLMVGYDSSTVVPSFCILLGVVHTLAYCFDNISAISLAHVIVLEFLSVRGPMPVWT